MGQGTDRSSCTEIHVTLEKDGSATISDNGRGVPVGMHAKGVSAERIVYTTLHAGGYQIYCEILNFQGSSRG